MLKEAMLYAKLDGSRVQCGVCGRKCVVPEGGLGFCRVRKNTGGTLYSLVYPKVCSASVDPITKKPLSHFHPDSFVFSVATVGCNFNCQFCQNWVISQERDIKGQEMPPQEIVRAAKRYGCRGVSYTYTEPTIFLELAYETSVLAHKEGLFNTYVTNGYMSTETVRTLGPYLDAATVDFKGSADPEFYRKMSNVPSVEPIFEALQEMKRQGVHIEITDLLVTKYGDSIELVGKLAAWVVENLGPDIPFHLLRFHPDYKLTDVPPTPVQTLEKAVETAKSKGLRYVYIGNVPGHRYENTYCPSCGDLLIERFGFDMTEWRLTKSNTCPKCGTKIAIVKA